jgi:hypothetical protein
MHQRFRKQQLPSALQLHHCCAFRQPELAAGLGWGRTWLAPPPPPPAPPPATCGPATSGAVSAQAATGTTTESADGSSRSLMVAAVEIWPWIQSIVVVTSPAMRQHTLWHVVRRLPLCISSPIQLNARAFLSQTNLHENPSNPTSRSAASTGVYTREGFGRAPATQHGGMVWYGTAWHGTAFTWAH